MKRMRLILSGTVLLGALLTLDSSTQAGVTLTTLVAFTGNNGARSSAPLVQTSDGDFYGTTYYGGAKSDGVIFRMTPAGALTVVASLEPEIGANPAGVLAPGANGVFYGTACNGGQYDYGSLFQVSGDGQVTAFVSFNNTNGANPYGGLVKGTDGNYYGTTAFGGASGFGTIFQVTPGGALTTLVSFNNTNGANPYGLLTPGADGAFYGTTCNGGTAGVGTVFRVTSAGALTVLASFGGTNGANPYAGLTAGNDGAFYGVTFSGGTNGDYGTVFKVTASGALASLASFALTNGAHPYGGLVQGADGRFYGSTELGGANNDGVLFSVTTEGALAALLSFDTFVNGSLPVASLALGADGNFYGSTHSGTVRGNGTIFRLAVPSAPSFQSCWQGGGSFHLAWSAVAGQSYQMQFKSSLSQTNWSDLGGVIVATNSTATFSDPIGPVPARYYRVRQLE